MTQPIEKNGAGDGARTRDLRRDRPEGPLVVSSTCSENKAPESATVSERPLCAEWQPIETAPKDGSVVFLTWMEDGEPQEIWPMQWGHIQRNGFFPDKTGMWVAPDGSVTWNGTAEHGGPTHWKRAENPILSERGDKEGAR